MSEKLSHIATLNAMAADLKVDQIALDMAAWAYFRSFDWPLAHYDKNTYWSCREEGDPDTRCGSNPTALMRVLRDEHPGVTLKVDMKSDEAFVAISISGYGVTIYGQASGRYAFEHMGRAFLVAGVEAHESAKALALRLYAIEDLPENVDPMIAWPIEELEPGRFYPVHHALKLAGQGASSEDLAREMISENQKGQYALLLCRERYLDLDPAPQNDLDGPSP